MGDSYRKRELHLGRTARKVKRNRPVPDQAVKEWIQTGTNAARIADSPAIRDLFRGLTAGFERRNTGACRGRREIGVLRDHFR